MSFHVPGDGARLDRQVSRVREAELERAAERRAADRVDAPTDDARTRGVLARARALLARGRGTRPAS